MKYYKLKIDMNGDGRADYFYSLTNKINGKEGNIWRLYLSRDDYFTITYGGDYTPVFRTDAFSSGYIEKVNKSGIGAYVPGSSSEGVLYGIYLGDDTLLHEVIIKQQLEPRFSDADAALYDDLIRNETLSVDPVVLDVRPLLPDIQNTYTSIDANIDHNHRRPIKYDENAVEINDGRQAISSYPQEESENRKLENLNVNNPPNDLNKGIPGVSGNTQTEEFKYIIYTLLIIIVLFGAFIFLRNRK